MTGGLRASEVFRLLAERKEKKLTHRSAAQGAAVGGRGGLIGFTTTDGLAEAGHFNGGGVPFLLAFGGGGAVAVGRWVSVAVVGEEAQT